MSWDRNVSTDGGGEDLHSRNIKSVNVLSQQLISPFNNNVMDSINESSVNVSFQTHNQFNMKIKVLQRALQTAEWERTYSKGRN